MHWLHCPQLIRAADTHPAVYGIPSLEYLDFSPWFYALNF